MAEIKCKECPMRAKYDKNPKSFIGRIWKFHILFCPGWKIYIKSLDEESKKEIAKKYSLKLS